MPSRRSRKSASTRSSKPKVTARGNVITADNDNLSIGLEDVVPDDMKGTSQFLDIVQWNLEWFGAQKSATLDRERFGTVVKILDALNGDLFVFQEVAGPSYDRRYPGALDAVAEELNRRGAGDYVVYYTEAGGEQRVSMMWDRRWLRAKTDVKELFPLGTHTMPGGKDPFGKRTPLLGYFTARVPEGAPAAGAEGEARAEKFDFQVLGVHLKAMAEGHAQRLRSAEVLADWLSKEAPKTDNDAMIMGDWNAPPDDSCWGPIHQLESNGNVKFRDINDPSDFSYLWLENRSDKFTSRIDLQVVSLASMQQVVGAAAQVVRWKPIEEAIARAGSMTDPEVVKTMRFLKEHVSDHMPTVSRFYFK